MSKVFRIIFYSLVGLIILSGLGLFLGRTNIKSYLHGKIDTGSVDLTPVVATPMVTSEKTTWQTDTFINLKEQVKLFSFTDICQMAAANLQNNDPAASTTPWEKCNLGNGLPFNK